ncbi:MAG: endolytic transglycosylase MltG, partial [Candidatus Marinimicrobia bacterium]|nr:endolytic transglycosylase MltG [Candidatus Neomarinimicrobiota bacterium]
GLPPGPINNPGRASILAAVMPSDVDYLYFVANGEGGHVFTQTFGEHTKAIKKIRSDD